jgi:hypothetical protein
MTPTAIVQKLWNFCNVLSYDGVRFTRLSRGGRKYTKSVIRHLIIEYQRVSCIYFSIGILFV